MRDSAGRTWSDRGCSIPAFRLPSAGRWGSGGGRNSRSRRRRPCTRWPVHDRPAAGSRWRRQDSPRRNPRPWSACRCQVPAGPSPPAISRRSRNRRALVDRGVPVPAGSRRPHRSARSPRRSPPAACHARRRRPGSSHRHADKDRRRSPAGCAGQGSARGSRHAVRRSSGCAHGRSAGRAGRGRFPRRAARGSPPAGRTIGPAAGRGVLQVRG